jgi:hypothetical protein
LPIIAVNALKLDMPDGAAAGAAPLSACKMKANAAVRIAIHLNIHGIRRSAAAQVIDWVPPPFSPSVRLPAAGAIHAMLRSDSQLCWLDSSHAH